jgi:hypothetical protein
MGSKEASFLEGKASRDTIAKQGNVPAGKTPEEFAIFVRDERVKWGKVVT